MDNAISVPIGMPSTSVCDTVCAICTPVIRIVDVFIVVSVSSHDDYRALVELSQGSESLLMVQARH